MSQTKAQLVSGLNLNPSAPATALQIDASGNINLDSNTLYVDATNNRVGLGTSAPQQLLQVGGFSGSNGITIGAGNSSYSLIYFADGTSGTEAYRGYLQYNHATDKLELGSAAATAITIDSSQRVGIGTTTVTDKLTLAHSDATGITFKATGTDGATSAKITFEDTAGGTGGVLTFDHNDNSFKIATAGTTERARIDSSGRLLVGTSTARTAGSGSGIDFQVEGAPGPCNIGAIRNSNNAFPARIMLAKTRGNSVGSNTAVQSGDSLGLLEFDGADGTGLIQGATIEAFVDGTPGTNDMPGRLVFSTTADGASSPTERMRISRDGLVTIGSTTAVSNERTFGVQGAETSGGVAVAHFRNTSSDAAADTSPVLALSKTRTTTSSSARFIQFYADNGVTPMGGIVGNGANNVQFATLSDVRDKENIQPLIGSLSKIKELQVVSYDWKANGEHIKAGFIAQNVETVFPEYIVENMASDGEEARKGITGGLSSGYVAVLTAALQEAIAKIEALEAEVAALKGA